MSEELKTGSPDQELTRQYRTAMHSLEEIHKRNLVEAVERGMQKDSKWYSGESHTAGCGCVLWFSFLMLIGFTGAACMSWVFNHSMLQALFHGVFGWLYICYKAFWYVVTNF
jgi:hypothetical protein